MQTANFTIKTDDISQINALKTILKAMKIDFKFTKPKVDKPYNPDFVAKILQGNKDIKDGKGKKITIDDLNSLWK